MTDQATGETPTTPTPAPETAAETVSITKAEWEKVQSALKEANKEAASRRKRLEELESADKAKKDAEMSELEKLQKKYQEAESKAAKLEREAHQRDVAAKVGLPAAFASRIQGETPEDMETDAKALLDAMPKPAPTKPNPLNPTNPGANAGQGETESQRRARIFSPGANIFDPVAGKAHGGGVFNVDKESQ